MRVITGVGSRETPNEVLAAMTRIGEWCREQEIYVRSGHADGADYAFERGALEYTIAYLPWKGFGKALLTPHAFVPTDSGAMQLAFASVDRFHPAPGRLSDAARTLMARNWFQVMGLDGKSPTRCVVCFTPGGKGGGGTGQAIRIAKAHSIPVFDFGTKGMTETKIVEAIHGIIGAKAEVTA